jgi:hypothetical protein
MTGVALNLWDASLYGDGSSGRGIKLTAYPLHEDGSVNSSVYTSVNLTKDDLPKRYVVDDEWAYAGSRKFSTWMELFISKQLAKKIK